MNKKVAAPGLENRRLTAVGTRCADHVTPLYPQKLVLTSPTGGGRSVGIVRSRTKATEFSFSLVLMEAYALFNNFITTVCYRDLTVILCNNTRLRTTRCDRRTYYRLGTGGRVVFNVLDNFVAFIKVKYRFNFRDNLKKF